MGLLYTLPAYVEPTMGGGDFLWVSRAHQPEPEERHVGNGLPCQADVFPFAINLESVLFRAECRQLLVWLSLVLVVEQVCLYLLICFLRFTCYYYFSLQFLLFLPHERFCFHLSQGYMLCSLGRTQLAEGGLSVLLTTFLATPLHVVTHCQAPLDEMKKLPFVNQLLV